MKTMGLFVKLHRQSCKLILCLNLVVSFKIFNNMATARFTWHLAMLILNVRWYEHLPGRFPNTKCQNLQQTQNWTLWNGSDSNQDLSIHCHNVWFLIPLLFRLYHLDFELASWKTINGNVGGIFTEPDLCVRIFLQSTRKVLRSAINFDPERYRSNNMYFLTSRIFLC